MYFEFRPAKYFLNMNILSKRNSKFTPICGVCLRLIRSHTYMSTDWAQFNFPSHNMLKFSLLNNVLFWTDYVLCGSKMVAFDTIHYCFNSINCLRHCSYVKGHLTWCNTLAYQELYSQRTLIIHWARSSSTKPVNDIEDESKTDYCKVIKSIIWRPKSHCKNTKVNWWHHQAAEDMNDINC